MSVSQGTKNLKFMQRAAARAGPSTATATEPTRKLLPGEASSQWTLPVTASHVGAKGKGKSAMNITYEHSFMPFLFDDDRENAEAGPSKQTGRVQFGKKEEEVKPPVVEDTPDDKAALPSKEGKQRFRVRQLEEVVSTIQPPQTDSRGFLKPSGFDDLELPSPQAKRKTADDDDDADVMMDGARKKRPKSKKKEKGKKRSSEKKLEQAVGDEEDREAQAFLDEVMNEINED